MQKDKKSKNARIQRLRMILDSESNKNLHPIDEKYLTSLNRRLEGQSKESILYPKAVSKDKGDKEVGTLEPKVVIHQQVKKEAIPEKKILEFPDIKEEKQKEYRYEDEDVFEVEKVEVAGPEFIEVKPKEITKEEKDEILKEEKASADEELTEWEPADVEKNETEERSLEEELFEQEPVQFEEISKEVEGEKIEDKEKIDVTNNFCAECGAELKEAVNFCPTCGNEIITDYEESKEDEKTELIEEIEPTPAFIPVKKVEKKEEQIEVEDAPAIEEPAIERDSKIEAFKEIESIDDETAVLLYDNGFTAIDALTIASLKDLTKIKGIKRKTAKKIKKEIEQKSEWESVDIEGEGKEEFTGEKVEEPLEFKPVTVGETAEGEITEEQIEDKDKIIEKEEKIEAFKDMESIDDETAVLLYDNGFTAIDALTIASLKDLTKIKGIKRKTAKKIKKEIEKEKEPSKQEEPTVVEEPAKIESKEEDLSEQFVGEEELKKDEASEIEEKILEYEPVKADDEFFEEEEEVEEATPIKTDEEDVFKDISSIDDKIAKLLKENGINSIDTLKNTTIKELIKIKGVKRKIAKQIKQEVNELDEKIDTSVEEPFERGENPFIGEEEDEDQWESFDEDKISDSKMKEIIGFRHKDYTLYEKEIKTESGKKRVVRFFSKADPGEGEPIELPKGYEVKENKKTSVPFLKKKK